MRTDGKGSRSAPSADPHVPPGGAVQSRLEHSSSMAEKTEVVQGKRWKIWVCGECRPPCGGRPPGLPIDWADLEVCPHKAGRHPSLTHSPNFPRASFFFTRRNGRMRL